jgi:cation diffusion facilitator family transporter
LSSTIENSSDVRARELSAGLRVTWIGAVVNVLLVVLKLVFGLAARSHALVADGVHSLSDVLSDAIVFLGLRLGRKEADADHPYGHGRIETMTGMVVGLILVGVAAWLAYQAISGLYMGETPQPGLAAIIVAGVAILLKEAVYRYTIRVGTRIRSLALVGNAWHHRSDALSSIAVLIGVGAARIDPDWAIADVLAALVVTVFILRVGGKLIWAGAREVIDTAPDREVLRQLQQLANEVDGVEEAHDLKARYSGANIFVEIHIVVDPDLTVRQGHRIADQVRFRLLEAIPEVSRVMVHVDPEPD